MTRQGLRPTGTSGQPESVYSKSNHTIVTENNFMSSLYWNYFQEAKTKQYSELTLVDQL